MNEQQWLACAESGPMLGHLLGQASDRKLRLFAVACCRRAQDVGRQRALETAEQYADWLVHDDELEAERERIGLSDDWVIQAFDALLAREIAPTLVAEVASRLVWHAGVRADHAQRRLLRKVRRELRRRGRKGEAPTTGPAPEGEPEEARATAEMEERRGQCELLLCIFGNPFRPVVLDSAWRAPTAVMLAQGIYVERAFDRLPFLADALEDAGCTSKELLDHLRAPGPHARGCFALDLLLGKQ
jgi:hypothetical protein